MSRARAYAVLDVFAIKSYGLAIREIDGGLMALMQVSLGGARRAEWREGAYI
jgi:hypothetical protein